MFLNSFRICTNVTCKLQWLLKSIKLFQTILYEYKVRAILIIQFISYESVFFQNVQKLLYHRKSFIWDTMYIVNFQEFYVCPPLRGSQHSIGVDVYTDVSAPAGSQVHSLSNHDAGPMVCVLYTQWSPTVYMYKYYMSQHYTYFVSDIYNAWTLISNVCTLDIY